MSASETYDSCGKIAHDGTACLESKSESSEASGHWDPSPIKHVMCCTEESKECLNRMSKYEEEGGKDDKKVKLLRDTGRLQTIVKSNVVNRINIYKAKMFW